MPLCVARGDGRRRRGRRGARACCAPASARSEVIVTIMLNFIVLALPQLARRRAPRACRRRCTRRRCAPASSRGWATCLPAVPRLGGQLDDPAWPSLAALFAWWYLFRTRGGYELRAVGLQPDAAEYGGMPVGRTWSRAMVWSGALRRAGRHELRARLQALLRGGLRRRRRLSWHRGGAGGAQPPGRASWWRRCCFATLSQGGLAVNALVPKQMVDMLQAVVILAVVDGGARGAAPGAAGGGVAAAHAPAEATHDPPRLPRCRPSASRSPTCSPPRVA